MNRYLAAASLAATGIGLGFVGLTLLLAGVQALECCSFVLRRD